MASKKEAPEPKTWERRPTNFNKLSAADQWEIDKELGILDWDGD